MMNNRNEITEIIRSSRYRITSRVFVNTQFFFFNSRSWLYPSKHNIHLLTKVYFYIYCTEHISLDHFSLDHFSLDHFSLDHFSLDHFSLDHFSLDHFSMDHFSLDHFDLMNDLTK